MENYRRAGQKLWVIIEIRFLAEQSARKKLNVQHETLNVQLSRVGNTPHPNPRPPRGEARIRLRTLQFGDGTRAACLTNLERQRGRTRASQKRGYTQPEDRGPRNMLFAKRT